MPTFFKQNANEKFRDALMRDLLTSPLRLSGAEKFAMPVTGFIELFINAVDLLRDCHDRVELPFLDQLFHENRLHGFVLLHHPRDQFGNVLNGRNLKSRPN